VASVEQSKDNRSYYLSRGRCPRCGGKNPCVEGRVLCIECQQKHDEQQIQMRDKWRESGLCTRCGGERDSWRKLCANCRVYMSDLRRGNAKAAKERRDRLRDAGMCTRCGKTWAEPGRSWCAKCQQRHRAETKDDDNRRKDKERREARRAAGLCIDCGRPTGNGHARCQECLAARRDSNRKYVIMQKIKNQAEQARRQTNANNA